MRNFIYNRFYSLAWIPVYRGLVQTIFQRAVRNLSFYLFRTRLLIPFLPLGVICSINTGELAHNTIPFTSTIYFCVSYICLYNSW